MVREGKVQSHPDDPAQQSTRSPPGTSPASVAEKSITTPWGNARSFHQQFVLPHPCVPAAAQASKHGFDARIGNKKGKEKAKSPGTETWSWRGRKGTKESPWQLQLRRVCRSELERGWKEDWEEEKDISCCQELLDESRKASLTAPGLLPISCPAEAAALVQLGAPPAAGGRCLSSRRAVLASAAGTG